VRRDSAQRPDLPWRTGRGAVDITFSLLTNVVRVSAVESTTAQLRPPRHLVSPAAVRYWTVRAAVGWLVLVAVQVVALVQASAGRFAAQAAVLAATVLLAAAHLVVMPRWRYRVHRWETTGEAVYTQTGWFSQERRIAPVSRIQTVDSRRGPIQQLFGLATVVVTTASAAGPLTMGELDQEVAQRLVDELTRTTALSHEDAT
jgi:membrane protein YdbS with pleckstrin-like domain